MAPLDKGTGPGIYHRRSKCYGGRGSRGTRHRECWWNATPSGFRFVSLTDTAKAPGGALGRPACVLCLEHDLALLLSTRSGLRAVWRFLVPASALPWLSRRQGLPFAASGLPACTSARSMWHRSRSVRPRALPCVKFSSRASVSRPHPWPCMSSPHHGD